VRGPLAVLFGTAFLCWLVDKTTDRRGLTRRQMWKDQPVAGGAAMFPVAVSAGIAFLIVLVAFVVKWISTGTLPQ
jgi:hypothetical protein